MKKHIFEEIEINGRSNKVDYHTINLISLSFRVAMKVHNHQALYLSIIQINQQLDLIIN